MILRWLRSLRPWRKRRPEPRIKDYMGVSDAMRGRHRPATPADAMQAFLDRTDMYEAHDNPLSKGPDEL